MKLQRDPVTGKLRRKANGKIIRSETCCCGQPPITGCEAIANAECAVGGTGLNAIPDTYKIVAASIVTTCPCVETGVSSSFKVTGNANRDYYIFLHDGITSTGFFFEALTTTYYSTNDCTGTPASSEENATAITFTLGDDGVSQQVLANMTADGFLVFFTSDTVVNFCGDPTTATNDFTDCSSGLGHDGTLTFTPCPPCAVDCEGHCAAVELTSGTNPYDLDGDWGAGSKGIWSNSKQNTIDGLATGMGPAGCYWAWGFTVDEADETYGGNLLNLYVWYDGLHYRGIVTRWTGTGNEICEFTSQVAGSVTCTSDVLTGTLILEGATGSITVTLTDCTVCPTDCDECCDTYTFSISNVCVGSGTYAVTRDTACRWVSGSPSAELRCSGQEWIFQLADPDVCNCTYTWHAPISGPCPPTNAGDWTLVSTGPECDTSGVNSACCGVPNLTAIATSVCPP